MSSFNLFLFDLDGTLVSTGGAGLRALGRAFKHLYGIDEAHRRVNPGGKTDPAIFREIIRLFFNRDMTEPEFQTIGKTYLEFLEVEMKTANAKPLPGVRDILGRLDDRKNTVVGLGTGNLEKGARLKLAPSELNSFFPIGGFGSDAEDRAEVLRHGHRRAQEKINKPIDAERVYVIGDTLLDVDAARRAGFKSAAVATGRVSYDTLRDGSPDFLMRDLTEAAILLEAAGA